MVKKLLKKYHFPPEEAQSDIIMLKGFADSGKIAGDVNEIAVS